MDTDKIYDRDKKIFGLLYIPKSERLNEKEQSMLEDGSISQEQYDEQQRKKLVKAIK